MIYVMDDSSFTKHFTKSHRTPSFQLLNRSWDYTQVQFTSVCTLNPVIFSYIEPNMTTQVLGALQLILGHILNPNCACPMVRTAVLQKLKPCHTITLFDAQFKNIRFQN